MVTANTHVIYVSPYRPQQVINRKFAERLLKEDRRRWLKDTDLGRLTDAQLAIGAPRAEALPPGSHRLADRGRGQGKLV